MALIQVINLFLLFCPIYVANSVPVIFAKNKWLKFLNIPVDFNKKIGGAPIFGTHKTYRGFVTGTIFGAIAALLVNDLFIFFNSWQQALIFGAMISFGALFGDLIKSFFKRRLKIAPGKNWIPFDQLDYVLGAILFSLFVIRLPLIDYIVLIIMSFLLHFFGNFLRWLFWRS